MIADIYKTHVKEINLKDSVYNYYFGNSIWPKKLKTKNILMDEKNYENLVIYFTRYVGSKSVKMLSLHYHELMRKIEELEEKNCFW